jgi:hypothetical protein
VGNVGRGIGELIGVGINVDTSSGCDELELAWGVRILELLVGTIVKVALGVVKLLIILSSG